MGAPYKLFVVMHLLKRILIHQKTFSPVNWINNSNVKIPEKSSVLEISMPPRQLLVSSRNRIIENLVVNDNGLRFHEFFNNRCLPVLNTWCLHMKERRLALNSPDQVTKKVYEITFACSWLCEFFSNCYVYNSYYFHSDHR